MHPAAYQFVAPRLAALAPASVLEIGSLDVNSSVQGLLLRALLPGATWVGIDSAAGPGVDAVSEAADYRTRRRFACVVSTEALEHAPRPADVIECAARHLAPGGVLLLTAAAPERTPHGCDGGAVKAGEHYRGISPAELRELLAGWADVEIIHDPRVGDVYATARR